MAQVGIREWALKGAEQRLVEIAAEAARIYAEFPELREGADASLTEGTDAPPRKRRRSKLSREARKRISEAQKARWAKHKARKKG